MKFVKVALGAVAGVIAGFGAGLLLAPRSGAESRAMASDAVNDAWDSAVDTYERGQQIVADKISSVRPSVDATTDELRAKVDLARERMDQLRDSLSAVADEPVEAEEAEADEEPAAVEIEITQDAEEPEAEEE